jgi:HTH-type transcriptional regulator, glycine betaine synthesis regulator
MEKKGISSSEESSAPLPGGSAELVREFVEHWGQMARAWGINGTMGELFALLYVTGTDWTAEDLRRWLDVSRGNVSMNLRELMTWGVVHKVQRSGNRRELFRAETDVWTLFRKILAERKRRELEPSLRVLDRTLEATRENPNLEAIGARIASLRQFYRSIDALAIQVLSLPSAQMAEIIQVLTRLSFSPASGVGGEQTIVSDVMDGNLGTRES